MNLISLIHTNIHNDVVTLDLLKSLLANKTAEAQKQIVKRACQKGQLVRVKNGIYIVAIASRETLFADKVNAIITRNYSKGRDWYDFLWHIKNDTKINLPFLAEALKQMGPLRDKKIKMTPEIVIAELLKKIKSNNWNEIIKDVGPFLRPQELNVLTHWNEELFIDRLKRIEFTD